LIWGDECMWAYGRSPEQIGNIELTLQFLHPDDLPLVMERLKPAIEGTGEYNAEFRILWPDGSIHWSQGFGKPVLSADGKPVAIVGFNIDISDRKASDTALIRTEKLAAVGRLASTMAHEINNPLEAVMNLLFLARNSKDLAEAKPFLDTADIELRRASAITNQALRFHKQATRPTLVTFQELTADLLVGRHSRMVNSHIVLKEQDRSTQPVLCFEGEIRQVLSNLVGNAIDAMHGRGGTLFIRGRKGTDWKTGKPGMVITIADTGIGMSAITQAKLFDAFFTTKGISGTGLGLWISKEIMDRHSGRIAFRSSEHRQFSGTVFTIFLPFDAVVRRLS
jgi:PAS domain S-box-containing protein